ncbi:phage protein [Vibrio phage pTD1]|uniref:Phage protein n=1 Tax=Vibrio phage pTD1 TaxID=1938577 RepID=A0A1Q2U380_9CAUD|nr:phage protein [Vibrio phage pTD1]BAW98413.1 phage protein [Vibrio phage pTD1]
MSIPNFGFLNKIESSESIQIGLNISPIYDINNGRFFIGKDDLAYCNGGMTPNNAVTGGSNTQKTGMLILSCLSFLERIPQGVIIYGDTEATLDIGRLSEAVDKRFGESGYFEREILNKRFIYLSSADGYDGTQLHNIVKDAYKDFQENKGDRSRYLETVFLDKNKKPIEIYTPIMVITDSLGELRFNEASVKFQEGDVDEGGKKRTRDMEFGNLKRIVFEDSHHLGGIAGLKLWWVGQITDVINMDGKPLEKQSTFIRQGKKIAKCPKAILQLPAQGYEIIRGSALKSEQQWMYPNPLGRDVVISADARENPDLLQYSYTMFRNKGGPSGLSGMFLGSQADGIQEGLTMYHALKTNGYFALDGSKLSHECTFLPGVKVGRTTVRKVIADNPKFYRALTIAYHIMKMQREWLRLPEQYRMTPEEIYKAVKDRGFDWDELLDSVDYWHTNPNIDKPTITAYQIFRLATGESVATGRPAKK